MAAIDRPTLLADTKLWLPDSNVLSDAQISFINESVITSVGDDDQYYGEVLCKSLQACANANKALTTVDSGNVTRERVGSVEIYYDSQEDTWSKYIAALPNICITFGYELNTAIGMKVNSGEVIDPLADCPYNKNDLYI